MMVEEMNVRITFILSFTKTDVKILFMRILTNAHNNYLLQNFFISVISNKIEVYGKSITKTENRYYLRQVYFMHAHIYATHHIIYVIINQTVSIHLVINGYCYFFFSLPLFQCLFISFVWVFFFPQIFTTNNCARLLTLTIYFIINNNILFSFLFISFLFFCFVFIYCFSGFFFISFLFFILLLFCCCCCC